MVDVCYTVRPEASQRQIHGDNRSMGVCNFLPKWAVCDAELSLFRQESYPL